MEKGKSIFLVLGLSVIAAGVFIATKIKSVALPKTQREIELEKINTELNKPRESQVFLEKAEAIWTNPNRRPLNPEESAKLEEVKKAMRLLL